MPEKTLSEVFGDIANAIREKTESQETMTPLEMADEISSILKPSGTITISESGSYNVTEYAEADVEVDIPSTTGVYPYDVSEGFGEPLSTGLYIVSINDSGDGNEATSIDESGVYVYDNGSKVTTPAYLDNQAISDYTAINVVYRDSGEDGLYLITMPEGLYYISEFTDHYTLSLNAGSTYTYEGDSTFTPYQGGGGQLDDGLYVVQYESEPTLLENTPAYYSPGSGIETYTDAGFYFWDGICFPQPLDTSAVVNVGDSTTITIYDSDGLAKTYQLTRLS